MQFFRCCCLKSLSTPTSRCTWMTIQTVVCTHELSSSIAIPTSSPLTHLKRTTMLAGIQQISQTGSVRLWTPSNWLGQAVCICSSFGDSTRKLWQPMLLLVAIPPPLAIMVRLLLPQQPRPKHIPWAAGPCETRLTVLYAENS